jgi:hypothetical protein
VGIPALSPLYSLESDAFHEKWAQEIVGRDTGLGFLLRFNSSSEVFGWFMETLRTLAYKRIDYIVFTRSLEQDLPIPEPATPFVFSFLRREEFQDHKTFFLPSEQDRFCS